MSAVYGRSRRIRQPDGRTRWTAALYDGNLMDEEILDRRLGLPFLFAWRNADTMSGASSREPS
jgi:hypothetical protein